MTDAALVAFKWLCLGFVVSLCIAAWCVAARVPERLAVRRRRKAMRAEVDALAKRDRQSEKEPYR